MAPTAEVVGSTAVIQANPTPNPTQGGTQGGQPGTGAGQTGTSSEWKAPEQFASKGWKSVDDVYKSYAELEKQYGSKMNESAEALKILAALDPYAEKINALIAEEQEKAKAGDKTGTEKNVDRKLGEALSPIQQQLSAADERAIKQAMRSGEKSFVQSHKDHTDYKSRITELLESGVVSVKDHFDPDAIEAALEAAYKIAKAEGIEKMQKAREAEKVAGGGGFVAGGMDSKNMPLDQLREYLRNAPTK